MTRDIILASASKNRQTIMTALNIPFRIVSANINEKAIRDPNLKKRAEKIAQTKAEVVARRYPQAIVIAADAFFGFADGRVLEKPRTKKEALKMILAESGQKISFFVGFYYLDGEKGLRFKSVDEIKVRYRKIRPEEAKKYVDNFPVKRWAGAIFPGNTYGAGFFEKIQGSLNSFIYGLPQDKLITCLEKSGIMVSPVAPKKSQKPLIAVCASVNFYRELIGIEKELKQLGFRVLIPVTAKRMAKKNDFSTEKHKTWWQNPADYKIKKHLMDLHFRKIRKADLVLVVNKEKNGLPGYIGGNTLMEISLAYFLKKPVFLLHPVDEKLGFYEEILGLNPTVLDGDLKKLKVFVTGARH